MTEKAIRFEDSAAAHPLCRLAHRIHKLDEGIYSPENDEDSRAWLESRLRERRREFNNRDEFTGLSEEWVPKSQIEKAVRRRT